MASIQVTRRLQYQELFGRWYVYLDDVRVAKLRRGKPGIISTKPGQHKVMIGSKSRFTRSNTLQLDLEAADKARLKCAVNRGYARMVFFGNISQNLRLAGSAVRKELALIELSVDGG